MNDSIADRSPEVIERRELLVPEPAIALAGMLDIVPPATRPGDDLPPVWHWIYLLERHREEELGPDGHSLTGIPAPPGPGRLRMFAGGRVTTIAPLRVGEETTRVTRLTASVEKQGRSGPLTFVTARSEYLQDGQVAVVDEQDIVYREPGSRLGRAPEAPATQADCQGALTLDVDPVLLFRFSALTYNAHRIHYDLDYVKEEGYPDLVVHGPLQALLMAERLRREGISLVGHQFAYRLLAPTYGSQRLAVTHRAGADAVEVSVHDAHGVNTASGRVTPAQDG